jgi:hypothetical protein
VEPIAELTGRVLAERLQELRLDQIVDEALRLLGADIEQGGRDPGGKVRCI